MAPTRPVIDMAGASALAASGLALDVADDEEPPPVEVGLLSGFALPVMQVLTPRMTPLEWALLNWSQMLVLVEVV